MKRGILMSIKSKEVTEFIGNWLLERLKISGCKGFVVGVSGGVDSAVTSTLAASTNKPVLALNLPINQESGQKDRANEQIAWLMKNYHNVSSLEVNLTDPFKSFLDSLEGDDVGELAEANSASRLRMMTLYAYANSKNYLVVGTGNKVEDYGIGFFTKYGDGGVDISPIADLLKSEVYKLSSYLKVPDSVQNATPTDGLWGDNRSDEDQIGASYDQLEWALNFHDSGFSEETLDTEQKRVLDIYVSRHYATKHKLQTPPVCLIPKNIKE